MMLAATSSWLVIRAPNRTRLASGITIGRSGSGPKHARHRADEAAVTNFRILHNRVDDRAARLADAYFADERHAVRGERSVGEPEITRALAAVRREVE